MDLSILSSTQKQNNFTGVQDLVVTEEERTVDMSSSPKTSPISPDNKIHPKEECDTFQSWALRNYGETSKTKTVTSKKYNRIKRTLTGDEVPSSENAKFRFWVKAKGFKLGPSSWRTDDPDTAQVLYVPTKVQTPHGTIKEFKRVAIVDDFYDIIYSMHVDPDSRGGKHAGQKRTYRAIAETYAFLPREAVTRFLMSCTDCQKRMHLSPENLPHHDKPSVSPSLSQGPVDTEQEEDSNSVADADLDASLLNFNIPITTTYLNHIKKKKIQQEETEQATVQDLSNSFEQDQLMDPSPSRDVSRSSEDSSSPNHNKSNEQSTSYSTKLLASTRKHKLPTSKRGKYVTKLKPHLGMGSLRRGQNTMPSESSVSPRTANLYKPYEAALQQSTTDLSSKLRNNTVTLSPQPASTAVHTNTQDVSQPSHHHQTGLHTGGSEMAHHYMTSRGYPNNMLYVHTDTEQTPRPCYNTAIESQTSRVKIEDSSNEPANLSMKHTDREMATTAYSYMNRYITGAAKSGFTDQDQMNMKLITMKQLILGYRESAAFLYRSAQELEQLLLKYS